MELKLFLEMVSAIAPKTLGSEVIVLYNEMSPYFKEPETEAPIDTPYPMIIGFQPPESEV